MSACKNPKFKITVGFVTQHYNDEGICTDQEFIAGDEVSWEDDAGNPVDPIDNAYFPFNMVQPDTHSEVGMFVIVNETNDSWWSNRFGWVSHDQADKFTVQEHYDVNLPIGGAWEEIEGPVAT